MGNDIDIKAMKLKRVLLVVGRYLKENPYRELRVKHLLEARGVEVVLAVPGRGLNKGGAEEELSHDPVFLREGAIQIQGEWDFRVCMRGCQMVLFSTWRSYLSLAQLARHEGRPTVNFNATSGLDHWSHGVDLCLIRCPLSLRAMRIFQLFYGLPTPPNENIRVVGAIQYEYPDIGTRDSLSRESFCRYYDFDPERPLTVLMPKGIGSFHYKVGKWFPHWNSHQVGAYNQKLLDIYTNICHSVRASGCNLLVKMHPTAYASYNCKVDEEYSFWSQYPWARVLHPEHTQAMYRHVDVGLGVNTHSAVDMAYFGKPFIFVDSELLETPKTPSFFVVNNIIHLPKGPSSHWHSGVQVSVNPWLPSWLGYYSRCADLADLLSRPETYKINQGDLDQVIAEFWYKNDGKSAERIVDAVINYGEEVLPGWQRRLSPSYWRGRSLDTLHRIRNW